MSSNQGLIIARRSLSLSKTYPVMAVFLTLLGSALSGSLKSVQSASAVGASAGVPFIAVPLQAIGAILFSMPVQLLFVYDKNNGVLEYLLSLGMSQRDVYRQYLKAALVLAGVIGVLDVCFDVAAGVALGIGSALFEIPVLAVIIGLSVVSFMSVVMMSFSSLQKQRVGSNQPLGMTVGSIMVLPTYAIPFVVPSIVFWADLGLAGVIAGLSLVMFVASSRLISREKLLP